VSVPAWSSAGDLQFEMITSTVLTFGSDPLDADRLRRELEGLRRHEEKAAGMRVHRVKGRVSVTGSDDKHMIQYVQPPPSITSSFFWFVFLVCFPFLVNMGFIFIA
jgi:hypothetical protein